MNKLNWILYLIPREYFGKKGTKDLLCTSKENAVQVFRKQRKEILEVHTDVYIVNYVS